MPAASHRPAVLIVDDSPDNLLALEALLKQEDREILKASSGRDALEILLVRHVALALIDVMMPEMDGFELAELIRGVDRTRHVPIIFITAGARAEYRVFTGYDAGAIDFLFKPIDERILKAKVGVLITLDQQRREVAQALAEAERARIEIESLFHLARSVGKAETPGSIYAAALDAVTDVFAASRAAILLPDDQGRTRPHASRGVTEPHRQALEGRVPADLASSEPCVVFAAPPGEPLPERESAVLRREGVAAAAIVPLAVVERPVGELRLYWDGPTAFPERDRRLALTMGAYIAEAIERARSREAERLAHQKTEEVARQLAETLRFNELFAAILAHDLRNPLAAIKMATSLIHTQPSRPIEKPLSQIQSSSRRMERMIDQLLDFTRIRQGAGLHVEPRDLDLAAVARQVTEELSQARPEWKFDVSVTGDARGQWDVDRLLQVVSNLAANGAQHGRPGSTVDVRLDGRDGERIVLEVHNAGQLGSVDRAQLFSPFRSRAAGVRGEGLGLGLYITHEFVRAHDGSIDVTSSDEGGTTFTVRLPRVLGAAKATE